MKIIQVIADDAEERSGIPAALRVKGAAVFSERLAVGDYVLSPRFAVERKSSRDLVDSLLNNRIFAQLDALSTQYERGALLIEGDAWQGDRKLKTPILARLYAWLSHRPNLTVIYSPTSTWSARILLALASEEQSGHEPAAQPPPISRRRARAGDPYNVLCAFPGVGPVGASRLLTRFGTIRAIATASPQELVETLGPRRGKRLHDLVTESDPSS